MYTDIDVIIFVKNMRGNILKIFKNAFFQKCTVSLKKNKLSDSRFSEEPFLKISMERVKIKIIKNYTYIIFLKFLLNKNSIKTNFFDFLKFRFQIYCKQFKYKASKI